MRVEKLDFDAIEVPEGRLRDLDRGRLERIVVSLIETGQMTPIEVVPQTGQLAPFRLVAGLHRWQGCQDAGLDGVEAAIYEGPADENTLRLREIDENLARADLSQYDRANFIAERARVWVARNGAIKTGRPKRGQVGRNSFIGETCDKFGISEREVRRHRERIERIVPDVWRALRGTHAADNGVQLDKIRRLGADAQARLLELLRPYFGQLRLEFDAAFAACYSQVSGAKARSPQGDDEKAEAMARAYRNAPTAVQQLFRKKVGLKHEPYNKKSEAA
jgi:ParB family transcriptional regulator, chromosome partitioning protein